jgi:hypothetical protein
MFMMKLSVFAADVQPASVNSIGVNNFFMGSPRDTV